MRRAAAGGCPRCQPAHVAAVDLTGDRFPPEAGQEIAASVIGVGSLAVWQFTTLLDTRLLNVRISAWTQAAVLFALGVMAAEAGWDGRLSRHTEHRLGQVTVVGVGLTLVLLSYTGARDLLDMALGGLDWASASFAILHGVVSIAFTLVVPGVGAWCSAAAMPAQGLGGTIWSADWSRAVDEVGVYQHRQQELAALWLGTVIDMNGASYAAQLKVTARPRARQTGAAK